MNWLKNGNRFHWVCLLLLTFLFASCRINPKTIHQAKKNYDAIRETAELVLEERKDMFETQYLSEGELKKRLQAMPCHWVKVTFSNPNYYSNTDSVVVFCRWGNPIAVVELIYDYSSKQRDLRDAHPGFRRVKEKLYYYKRIWQIS